MLKLATIIGARPQFIKAGAVSREIRNYNNINEILIHTGQHYDPNMSDIFFDEMKLPKPDYFLGVQSRYHGAMTGAMIIKIEEVLLKESPDIVLVYGDTNSTLAGAIAASKLHIPVAHVEAGLRSFNMIMPEEINRILADRISTWLFCPTESAVNNLKREGYLALPDTDRKSMIATGNSSRIFGKVINVGDVMYDAALYYKNLAKKPHSVTLPKNRHFILCTVHRAENTDNSQRLKSIFEALEEISQEIPIILPLHPRTKQKLKSISLSLENITVIEPIGYLEMIWLLNHCKIVITDSGGLQKEAYFFKKPCITLRNETEWIELVLHGFNVLVGTDKENILRNFREFSFNKNFSINLFGEGNACQKIIQTLL